MVTEDERRAATIAGCWTACGQTLDGNAIGFIVRATSRLAVEQLESACSWVATHGRKHGRPILEAVMDAVDPATRDSQRKAGRESEPWVIPTVRIDHGRLKEQMAILLRYKRPSSIAQWSESELAEIRRELEADSPTLAEYSQKVEARLAEHVKRVSLDAPSMNRRRNQAVAALRQPGEES